MRFFRLRRTGFITDKLTVHINKSKLLPNAKFAILLHSRCQVPSGFAVLKCRYNASITVDGTLKSQGYTEI